MRAKVFLSLFLITLLIIPGFADSYIITPSKDQIVLNGKISISSSSAETIVNISCNPIYGTNSCSGELNESQINNLSQGYKIYPNLKVHAFLDQSVPQIQADKVWKEKVNETNLTGKGQTVCIIDTGIDYNHSALGDGWGNKVIAGWRFLDGCTITNQSCNCTYNNSACWDDNGHGTHVAGIVASNNITYRGVAPDSKLVIVKALNSSGEGTTDNIIAGINYCTDKSEEYNISVISMSLGDETYHNTTYCNEELPTLTAAINNATANNISVIVASGNENNNSAISLPACIQNATPVGSVDGSDGIPSYSNYWDLPILFAPGGNASDGIYSTIPGSWNYKYGTSMAAPHVAGVFALMKQYLKLSNKTKTPQELEDMAEDSGYKIDGNENHSRIDAYNFYLKISSTNLTTCAEITSPGYYNLTEDVSSSATCFTIKADNVTLDCKGYQINYSTTLTGYAIDNSGGYNNITIKNCGIVQGSSSQSGAYAIYFKGVNKGLIENSTINNLEEANDSIHFENSSNINITDSTMNRTYLKNSNNIRFINSSYSAFISESSFSLYRYWYLDINVTNSTGDTINETNITGKNKFNETTFSEFTGSNNYIPTQILLEYNQTNSSVKTYFTNYTIHGFRWGTGEDTKYVNLTESKTITLNLTDKAPITIATAKTAEGQNYTFGTWTNSSYVNITLNCTDYGENCNTTLYCNNTTDTCDPNIEYNETPVQILIEGTTYIRFRSNDTEGHTEGNKTKTIKIDGSPPQIEINSPQSDSYLNNRTIKINLTVTEPNLNYTNISIYNSSGSLVNSTTNSTNGTYTVTLSVLADGDYNITATAYDNATNFNSSFVSIKVDTTNQSVSPLSLEMLLKPGETSTTSFEMMNVSENVSLSISDNYLTYSFGSTTQNNTSTNFTFIVPRSANLTANLTWINSTNNLVLNLTNLRIGQSFSNTSGTGNFSTTNLNASNVSYGIWKATVFGENISTTNETFNLTIKLLDNRFKINLTDIRHIVENKEIVNNTEKNWTFYVDNNSVSSINVSLVSNATNEINLSLYNSTNSLINSNKTTNGTATISASGITEGNWKVKISNTNSTESFNYNLTIHLLGNNITKLGNLTTDYSNVTLTINSPPIKITDGNYTSDISIISQKPTKKIPLTIMSTTQILKLIPNWTDNYYIGNQSLEVGETETYNTTRNLFINLNQTKSLIFIVNNSGSLNLTNLTLFAESNNSLNISFKLGNESFNSNTTSPINISKNNHAILNITVFSPNETGNYFGWVYLNSSNGQPFKDLNLSLNFDVTNQTLPRLNKTNNVYYFESASNNQLPVGFRIYFFDNQTVDEFWNSSIYHLNLTNSTGNVVQENINFTFNHSTKLFSANINTTNLTEGNYTILGNINDTANNTADINLTFELLYNLNLSVISNLGLIVKGYPFEFKVNVSKPGNLTAENVTVCLSWSGTGLDNLNSSNCSSIGNINNTNSDLATWNFSGSEKKNYTININTYSEDGRFNYTEEEKIVVRYGVLDITWITPPPSSKTNNTEFTIKIRVKNTGDWNATNVGVGIDTPLSLISGGTTWTIGTLSIGANSTHEWNLKGISVGTKSITISATGNNATPYTKSEGVDINTPSSSDDGSGGDTSTYYGISFLKPTSSSFYIAQGGTYDLEVKLKNTGNAKLNDLYLTLSGLDSDYYSITPSVKDDLISGSTEYTIHFSIPDDFEAKDYDLTLKAISNEKNETKSITLTVEQKDLQVYEITNLNITQGETGTLTFYVKNTGEIILHKVYPALTGISGELFEINSSDAITLYKDKTKHYSIKFTIPKTENIGTKEINLIIASDEINISQLFNLTILPCEEEKLTINKSYENLTLQFENLLEEFEKAKKENKNTTSIASEIESANLTLAQIKKYISNGNYAEAKTLIETLDTKLNSMSSEFENLETINNSPALLIIAIVGFLIMLVGIVVAYTFIPRKGYVVGKGYTMTNKKSKIEQSIKNIFKKLGIKESDEDKLRKRKLTEWRKWYKQETKKRKY